MPGFPVPQRQLSQPAFRTAVRASGRPGWMLTLAAGLKHHSKFSALVNAESIPATQTNIDRLYRIADAIGFDRSQLFVDGCR